MRLRVIVAAVIRNEKGEIFLCKMREDRGVFPGQWVLPGGGIEEGERMDEALHREIWEETGLKIDEIEPFQFRDDQRKKLYADGTSEELYMIYLTFTAKAVTTKPKINDEHEAYRWVRPTELNELDVISEPTREVFEKMGLL